MKPLSQSVKTKGAPKKVKSTPNDNSTTRSPSYCENVDKRFPDSPTPKSHKYIDWIVNVAGDGNCGFRAVSALLGKGEDTHELVRHDLIEELVNHKDSYMRIFADENKFEMKPFSSSAPHLLQIQLIVLYVGWLAKSRHFVQVYLKLECPIPPTSPEWNLHHTKLTETWPDIFVDRMHEFERLKNIDKISNAEKSKLEPPIDLAGNSSFHVLI
ncbi:uncharacterized protein LOC131604099 [Vicia villosa]|uniref:uncharacterized protein LOC131604099 n=1 Tax=Vicia villosa TaxID=3911 RepID=UPI00273B7B50|nr:uncharacterized protein LOC131604099 [Vicia villosa]